MVKLNEKLIKDYMDDHRGSFISSWQLVSKANACEKALEELTTEELFELDQEVFNIGRKYGFYLCKRHHWNEVLGMPWNIDFEIIKDYYNVFEDKLEEGSYVRYRGEIMIAYDFGGGHNGQIGLLAEDPENIYSNKKAYKQLNLHYVDRNEVELIQPYCADEETLRRLFRLEVTSWDLIKEGKYPFSYDSDGIEVSEEDMRLFCERVTNAEVWTCVAWHKAFIRLKLSCQKEAEPYMSIATLWGIFANSYYWFDFAKYDDRDIPLWYSAYEKNRGKLLSEMDLNERQKYEFCEYLKDISDVSYPSAEQIKAYRKNLDELIAAGRYEAIKDKAWGSYNGNLLIDQDWKEAEKCLLKLYEIGNDRQFVAGPLGCIYLDGRLGEPDYDKAFRFLSEVNNPLIVDAQYRLADMYRDGLGIEKDSDKAFHIYNKLYYSTYKRGYDVPNIAFRMGLCCENGIGTKKDLLEARRYYVEAEEAIRNMDNDKYHRDNEVCTAVKEALERTKKVFELNVEYGALLYTIINNEYRFLVLRNKENSYSFFRIACDKEITVEELEDAIREKLGFNAKIERWLGDQMIRYSEEHICTFYIGRFEADNQNHSEFSLLDYQEMQEVLEDQNDKDLLKNSNRRLIIQKSAEQYRNGGQFRFDYKCLPYIPLDEEADEEVRKCIEKYKDSELYDAVYRCAKTIRYLYGNSDHLEDNHHNDIKYLNELIFHVSFWYPTYLDWLESPRNPRNM